ncbi:extra-cytoplasmic solute receptor [Rhodoplanes sp. Z2-YC6860]|nr:extra-cytoplasmic solute receptor [Rhodoplanes sp. Z2-YC6860]
MGLKLHVAVVCLSLFLAGESSAGDWPNRAVKVVAPVGPGGYTDVMARVTTDRLARMFGKPFVVENRAGAGGLIGTEYVTRSAPDGYTLWFGGGAQFTSAPLIKKLPYDPVTGLAPISMFVMNGLGLVVPPTLPVKNLSEFVAYAKARPGKINYGISGTGQSTHLAAALWASREKLDLVMVPYPTVPASMLGVMTGEVQMYFGNMVDLVEQVRSKKVRLLAVSSSKRLALFPDTPTFVEEQRDFTFTSWVGYFTPTGTPAGIIDKLSKAVSDVCREQEVIDLITGMGAECIGSSPGELAAAIQADLPLAKAAVDAAGLSGK